MRKLSLSILALFTIISLSTFAADDHKPHKPKAEKSESKVVETKVNKVEAKAESKVNSNVKKHHKKSK